MLYNWSQAHHETHKVLIIRVLWKFHVFYIPKVHWKLIRKIRAQRINPNILQIVFGKRGVPATNVF